MAAISRMKKALGGKYTCYVLIACSTPAENGNMDVEMHFEGDETLAAFLVENASQAFEERQGLQESGC
ncbi:MAG: hypothetical protein HY861_03860 [Chlamydiia bacterium]|nr:hypothetical protein [Chlamydiia bacterium]